VSSVIFVSSVISVSSAISVANLILRLRDFVVLLVMPDVFLAIEDDFTALL